MGLNPELKFILQYQNQWAEIENGYSTYSFSTLYPFYFKEGKKKLDIGVDVFEDKAGAFSTLDFSLAIGYNLHYSEAGYLNLALIGGFIQQSINTANLTFDQQYVLGSYSANNSRNETIINQKVIYPDVGFGLLWYYYPVKEQSRKLNAYLGVSAFHLNKPDESLLADEGALPLLASFQGGIKIVGENRIDFTPNVVINTQMSEETFAAGLLVDYYIVLSERSVFRLTAGAWYQTGNAVALSFGYSQKTVAFMYSYDAITSQISNYISGLHAHEITLSFKINQSLKKRAKANPSFF